MKKMLMLGAVSVLSIAMGTAVFASDSFGGETKEAAVGKAARQVCTTMDVNAKDGTCTYTDENHGDYCRYHTEVDHDKTHHSENHSHGHHHK